MSDFQELHDELRAVARDILGEDSHKGALDWSVMEQAGWIGLEVPEEYGGAGASLAETAVILDEIGRAAAGTAYLGGAVLSVGVLNAVQPSALRDELLAASAGGARRLAVALPTGADDVPVFDYDGQQLSGRARFVPDAAGADEILALATGPDGKPVVVHAPADAFEVTAQPVLDETRDLSEVSASGLRGGSLLSFAGDPDAAAALILDRARLAVACDSLGLAEAMLAATVSYAQVREQFGRPIGSFQAVKHACADMLVGIIVGRRLVAAAVDALCADSADTRTAVLMAKAAICDSAVDIVGKAMQLHGGIGYTWESGVHVYLKRATLNRALFGTPAAHRRQLAQRYL